MSVDVLRMLPAATLLRLDRALAQITPLAATPAGSTVHVLNRPGGKPLCGRNPRKLAEIPVDSAEPPPMRVCTLCARQLPASTRVQLAGDGRPSRTELAAVHEHAARQAAQQCIDALAEIRSQANLDGTAGHQVELMIAVPAEPGPRPLRRSDRARSRTGHVAGAERMTLVQLINRLNPCGFAPGSRVFITGTPALGAHVDVGGFRAAGGA